MENKVNKTKEEVNKEPILKENRNMAKLWVLRLRLNMDTVEDVPVVYRVIVYTEAVKENVITIKEVPENYKERIQKELSK